MPRSIHPELLDCLRRPNPYTEIRTEVSSPDVGQILRRPDQFTGSQRVSISPANSMAVSANGALQLAPSSVALADFPGVQSSTAFDLNKEDPGRRHKGLSWTVSPAFSRATIRSFAARVGRNAIGALFNRTDFQLEIFRVTRTPGVIQKSVRGVVTVTPRIEYTFRQMLSSPAVIKGVNIVWVANRATLVFDLSAYGLVLENNPDPAPGPDQVGDLPNYYFILSPLNGPGGTGAFFWLQDTGTSPTVANVGTFSKIFWERNHEADPWVQNTTAPSGPPSSTITVDAVATTSQAVYSINLGRAPSAGALGRVVFERSLPPGTTALLEISTAGTGGPWTAVKHGDSPALAQQNYHLRLTLTADAPLRASPGVSAFGIEYRMPTDISLESILQFPAREIATPWLAASIAEARAKVVRTGIRDYNDVATRLGSAQSPPKLEADIFLASRHPSITRDKWLRLERMTVSNRFPSSLAEDFTLLSYAAKLKRKIPGKVETINTVHTVQSGSDVTKIIVAPNLPNVVAGDNSAYDTKHYYMRVQSTANPDMPVGYTQEIQGNTGVNQIDFTPSLPSALSLGDTIEIHSGIFNTKSVAWQNADPADVWWQILTVHLDPPIPPERIGQGFLPRGGKPPRITDRAPSDTTTQAKLTVTMRLSEQESADELLDQVSFIMGGATIEVDGQMCFVQIYPLRAADGTITVPLPPVAAIMDVRDYTGLTTPPGIEERATVLTANYGENKAAANPDAFPAKTTAIVDNDALQWLTKQDLEDQGTSELPDSIARWLYNTADGGLYLATTVGTQVVRATSTGKRVFTLTSVEAQPHLIPGDPIIIITDAYTDYDPASGVPLKGWLAIKGVTVRVANQGRAISLFILGLAENVAQIQGGAAAALTGLGTGDSLFGLVNFRVINELPVDATYPNGALVYGWTNGALVDEVWEAHMMFTHPLPADPWVAVVTATVPLATGTTSITVPKPPEGSVLFLQVEPRTTFLDAGEVRRVVINAAPTQLPLIELDDIETTTTGTQWWSITERGLKVIAVEVQTQVGTEPISSFGPPTRGPGAASVVRGGLLGPGQYEHDVALDPTRLAWIMPRLTLDNGQPPKTLGPFGFDRDKRPNILSLQLVGTVISIIADSDTKSIRVINSAGTWIYEADGVSLQADVSKTGTNGAAGLGASSSDTYTIIAQSDPLAYVDGSTLTESRNQVVGGTSSPPPSATWNTPGVIVSAPPSNGNANAKINLFASAAPVGWTVQVFIYVGFSPSGTPTVDHTADLTPALSAPPTTATDYTYATSFPKSAHTAGTALVTMKVRADLKDGGGIVRDTRTMQATWYSPI
jgi:hypothetical protein